MPTVAELLKRSEYLVDDTIDVDIAISFFNEAIADLSSVYGIEKKRTFTGNDAIELPDDFMELVSVVVVDGDREERAKMITEKEAQTTRYAYRLFGNDLEIFPKGSYTLNIEYYASIPKLTTANVDASLTEIPQFDERFHRALSIYTALQYAENDDNTYKINNLKLNYQEAKEEMRLEFHKKKQKVRSRNVHVEIGWY